MQVVFCFDLSTDFILKTEKMKVMESENSRKILQTCDVLDEDEDVNLCNLTDHRTNDGPT